MLGAIPRQPSAFQPRPYLMTRLNRAVRGVSVLTGVRGAGKTELAAQYARAKLAGGWRLAAWVNAGNTESLLGDLAAVADAVGLSDGCWEDAANAGREVRRWLEADGNSCLLVFDDAKDPDALRPFVPTSGTARVLITSSEQSVADLGTDVWVDVFTAAEALAVLAGQTNLADDAGAGEVAAELKHLPLALTQAATVIAGQRLDYGVYLERLRALPVKERLAVGEGQPYPPGVAEAVLLSLDQAQASGHAGICAGMMEMIAVLSSAGVQRQLLHAAGQAGVLAGGGQWAGPDLVDRAVEELSDQSLLTVSVNGQVVVVHGLVRQVVRQSLIWRGRMMAVCRAAALALEARAGAVDMSQDREAIRDITKQMTALLDNTLDLATKADNGMTRALVRLRFFALRYLTELGDSTPQAIAIGEPLIADLKRMLGSHHPDTLNSLDRLATAYRAAGRADEAIPLFQQTLVARERLLGPDHPDTLNSQNNLAAACQDAGRAAEAILLFRMTLAAREQLLGTDHLSTVNSRGSLAAAYRAAGRADEAIPLFEQTLATQEQVLGPDHADTLRSLSGLANAYRESGQFAEAIPVAAQLLTARERLLGVNHPRTLSARNNLAVAYRSVGQVAEAVPLFQQNVAACERLLGAEHPKTSASRHHLDLARQEAARAEKSGRSQQQD
jgi:tetratricopeptide (TPR) repeat protein